jgi:hypothetical protein
MNNHNSVGFRLSDSRRPATGEFETVAWGFLGSEFAGDDYINWSIERRIEGYLRHHGMTQVFNDGDACDAVLQHVLAAIHTGRRSTETQQT